MLPIFVSLIDDVDEKNAFENVYCKYKQDMFNLAYSMLKDVNLAEDVVQETFLDLARVWSSKKLGTRETNHLKAYIAVITKRKAIKKFKDSSSMNCEEYSDEMLVDFRTAEDEYIAKYDYGKIREIIRSLPDIYSEVLYLHFVFGFSLKEIAKQLDENYETIKKRFQRALAMLRENLEKEDIHV
jgi:RNA polymerase sigma-70 factor (ECF subfamily)